MLCGRVRNAFMPARTFFGLPAPAGAGKRRGVSDLSRLMPRRLSAKEAGRLARFHKNTKAQNERQSGICRRMEVLRHSSGRTFAFCVTCALGGILQKPAVPVNDREI